MKPSNKWNNSVTTEPVEEGVYFVRVGMFYMEPRFSYWDGTKWMLVHKTRRMALKEKIRSGDMYQKGAKWCGAK